MTIYSVAIIGCGGIGYQYNRSHKRQGALSYFRVFHTSPNFRVVGIADVDDEIRDEIHQQFNVPGYRNVQELLESRHADVVIVASPEDTHASILREVLGFHPKLVFCEKPLACTLDEVENLVKAYENENIALAVNYSRRYLRVYEEVRQNISSGKLGTIQSVLVYYSRGFLHNASHYLDLFLWWFGEPDEIRVEDRREGLSKDDPTLSVWLKYAPETEIRLVGLGSSDVLINEIDIIGSLGRIQIDTMGQLVVSAIGKHPDYDDFRRYWSKEERCIDLSGALPNAVNNIYRWLEREVSLKTPARDSVTLHRFIKRIIEDAP